MEGGEELGRGGKELCVGVEGGDREVCVVVLHGVCSCVW